MTDVIHNYDVLVVGGGGSAARSAGTNASLAATS